MNWHSVRALTFDCYGTLVDWETGLARDLRAGLDTHVRQNDETLLAWFGEAEPAAEAGPFRVYREVLRDALARVAERADVPVRDPDALACGLITWPVFPDTADSLRRLQRRFKLCVVSNVDRDLFAETERRIGVLFDEVVTADEVRSYKPACAHFHEAIRRLGVPLGAVVHVAQSLFHDVAPARSLGLSTVWVDRRAGRTGGATAPAPGAARPDLRVESLRELAELVDAAW